MCYSSIINVSNQAGPEEVAAYHGTSGYWRYHYFTALEGSLRAPFIIRWPSKIQAKVSLRKTGNLSERI